MSVTFWLYHKSNWQDHTRQIARRNRFMQKLKEGVVAFGINLTYVPIEYQRMNSS
ncbi:hypothetical protein HDU92_005108 [Lobulomyces angularis]|nr:hypothetical protein HDU92_005108 [Lobulomyces angularis]